MGDIGVLPGTFLVNYLVSLMACDASLGISTILRMLVKKEAELVDQ